jgi:hypothetical protein
MFSIKLVILFCKTNKINLNDFKHYKNKESYVYKK